jgi:hypothetical protein
MLTEQDFESIIKRPESSILDYKSQMYELTEDKDLKNMAKLVKDIVSFANTVRTETSYIIVGVEEKENGSKGLIGINEDVDDSILQNKLKDKVYPRPRFSYYSLMYNGLKFGIFEFPVTKYSWPITPTVKMKGLEIGRVYYRQGSSNMEALSHEVIRINEWLKGLVETNKSEFPQEELTELLKRITSREDKLSTLVSDVFYFSKKFQFKELQRFCRSELRGLFRDDDFLISTEKANYRIQTVYVSYHQIELNPYSPVRVTEDVIREELEKSKDFYQCKFHFPYSVSEIEEHIKTLDGKFSSGCAILKTGSKKLFPNIGGEEFPVYVYVFKSTFLNLYKNIRQHMIDQLVKI